MRVPESQRQGNRVAGRSRQHGTAWAGARVHILIGGRSCPSGSVSSPRSRCSRFRLWPGRRSSSTSPSPGSASARRCSRCATISARHEHRSQGPQEQLFADDVLGLHAPRAARRLRRQRPRRRGVHREPEPAHAWRHRRRLLAGRRHVTHQGREMLRTFRGSRARSASSASVTAPPTGPRTSTSVPTGTCRTCWSTSSAARRRARSRAAHPPVTERAAARPRLGPGGAVLSGGLQRARARAAGRDRATRARAAATHNARSM